MAKTSKAAALAVSRPYLKSVHLRDYRSLRDVRADFKPGINIIIGKNGSGKTNFLSLVGELVELRFRKFQGAGCTFVLGGKEELTVAVNEATSNSLELLHTLTEQRPLEITVSVNNQQQKAKELLSAIRELGADFSQVRYNVVRIAHGLPSYRLPMLDSGADLTLSRGGRLTLLDSPKNWFETVREVELLSLVFLFVFFSPLLRDDTAKNNEAAPDLVAIRHAIAQGIAAHLAPLNVALPTYSPLQEVRCSEQFQVYWAGEKRELLFKGLVFEYRIHNDWLPFRALSDGTKRVFFMLSQLLALNVSMPSGLPAATAIPKIILLEEPELGIHPQQLQLLLQLLREVSKEQQLIITTHSPQVLDLLNAQELDRITICDYVPGKGTQLRKLSPAKRAKAKAYLRDQGFLSEFWRFSTLEDPD